MMLVDRMIAIPQSALADLDALVDAAIIRLHTFDPILADALCGARARVALEMQTLVEA